jgi:threonine dehydratase
VKDPAPTGGSLTLATVPLGAAAIEQAATQIHRYLTPTPLQPSGAFSSKAGCHVYLKLEGIQPTRSFKVRGALHKVIQLRPEERAAGIITASAGNHGQGVAYAARVFDVPATIYVPNTANPLKVEAIRRLGGAIVQHGRSLHETFLETVRVQAETGATYVHPFDDPDVIAGQATLAVEAFSDLPEVDTILVPVGGGGLIAGVGLYVKERFPHVRVIGVEPAGADSLTRSLEQGKLVTLDHVETIADGLATSAPGRLPLEIASRTVDDMIRVQESEMERAIRLLFEWEHVLAEPAGAATAAALLYHHRPRSKEKVLVLITGANVTKEVLVRSLKNDRS